MMPHWKSYGLLAAGAAAAFAAGRMTRGPASDAGQGVAAQGNATAAKPGFGASGSPATASGIAATVRSLEGASLAECEELLRGAKLCELQPLVAEALLQRLSELAPERLAELLLDAKGGGTLVASWQRWIHWLGRERPDLLEGKHEDPGLFLSAAQRTTIEGAIVNGRLNQPDPLENLQEILAGKGEWSAGALAQLAETDPDEALHFLGEFLKNGGQAWNISYQGDDFYLKLARANPVALQALLPLMRSVEQQMKTATALAKVLAGDDPAQAVALYQSMSPSRARSTVAIEIADAWAKRDPAAALAWVQSTLPEGEARRRALALCLAPIAESDPLKVLALLPRSSDMVFGGSLAFYDSGNGSQGIGGGNWQAPPDSIRDRALLALMASQPQAALELVRSGGLKDYDRRSDWGILAKGAAEWLGRDPAAALSWLAAAKGDEATALYGSSGFTRALVDMDPAAIAKAADALASAGNPDMSAQLAWSLAASMVLNDPAGAIRQADKLPEALRQPWLNAAMSKYVETDLAGATAIVSQLTEAQRRKVSEGIASAASGERAVAYLQNLPAAEQEVVLYQQALERWSPGSWALVAQWWGGLTDQDQVARAATLSIMAGRIYGSDPSTSERLIGEIGQIPDAELRMRAFQSLISTMASKDPQAAQALAERPGMDLPEDGLGKAREELRRYLEEKRQQ